MQLDRARSFELTQQVFLWIGLDPEPAVLKELVGWEATANVLRFTKPYQVAVWVVDQALRARTAEVLIKVVRTVDPPPGALVDLHALVNDLDADPSGWSAEVDIGALWAPPKWPFVDRDPLRSILGSMAQGEGPASLSVEGPHGHGKHAVTSYIEQLAGDDTGPFQAVVAELRREPSPGLLIELVARLRLALELDPEVKTTHAEPDRRGEALARDLALEAPSARAPRPVWLVANVLDPTGVEEGVLPFIDELLRLIATVSEVAAKIRVVLLAESASRLGLENLPEAQHRHVLLPDIDQKAVAGWLAAAAPGKDEEFYALASERVIQRMDENPPALAERLQRLALGCAKAHQTLVGSGG